MAPIIGSAMALVCLSVASTAPSLGFAIFDLVCAGICLLIAIAGLVDL